MARPDKAAAVAELTDSFRESNAAVLTEYRGLTVAQLKELRRSLAGNATYAVVKNTLTKIAAKEAGVDTLDPLLEGPSAIAFITGDPVEVAKSLRDFGRNHPLLVVKGGVLEGKALTADEVRKLADLESREVLLAKLAGAMKASLSQAVYLLNAPLAQAARLLGALEENKRSERQASAEAPAAEAPAAEAPAAEAPAAEAPAAEAPAAEAADPVADAAPEAEMPSDATPGVEETPPAADAASEATQPTAADAAGDEGAAAQAVADATDVPSDTDVAGDATSAS